MKKFLRRPRLPIQEFLESESTSGILLIAAAVIALIIANSPLSNYYFEFFHTPIKISFSFLTIDKSIHHWVNDGLMALFFLLVGMEIKRELVHGELSNFKFALLPIIAACGGAIVPAIIYLMLNGGTPSEPGWGIPMATDIAFAVGVLALLGKRIPLWAKIFLTALAVVDDLLAVLVIAIFYTANLNNIALFIACGIILILVFFNWNKVKSLPLYIIFGVLLWIAVLKSGVHATIAGVILGLIIPVKSFVDKEKLVNNARKGVQFLEDSFSADEGERDVKKTSALNYLRFVITSSESPLHRLEHKLNNWVAFLIMPLFAFANSGLVLSPEVISQAFSSTITWGIILGLFFGKQVGIFLSSLILIAFRLTSLKPTKKTLIIIYGMSIVAGIGFTMSLFISNLAFKDNTLLEYSKIGIISVSLVCGVFGYLLLKVFTEKNNNG